MCSTPSAAACGWRRMWSGQAADTAAMRGACARWGRTYNRAVIRTSLAAVILLGLSAPLALARPDATTEPKVWEFQSGRWPEIPKEQLGTTQPAPDPQLVMIEQMVIAGQYDTARQL